MDSYVYLGTIFLAGYNFAPLGFSMFNGQTLTISSNTALFSLLGTNFGGNGTTNFQLPNLQGRVPVHMGSSAGTSTYVIGQSAGSETTILNTTQLPSHSHALNVNNAAGNSATPGTTTYLAAGPATGSGPNASQLNTYTTVASNATLNANSIGATGSNQPFSVLQPYLTVNFIIAMVGIFPSRN